MIFGRGGEEVKNPGEGTCRKVHSLISPFLLSLFLCNISSSKQKRTVCPLALETQILPWKVVSEAVSLFLKLGMSLCKERFFNNSTRHIVIVFL